MPFNTNSSFSDKVSLSSDLNEDYVELEKGTPIDDVFFFFFNPNSNCSCRKPKPKMFFDAKEKYNIDLENSIMIGDKITDALGAYNAGVGTIYLINNDVELDIKVHRIRSLLEAIK